MNENFTYREEHIIQCHEVDSHKSLKPVAFMNIAQAAAHVASTEVGFGYRHLIEKGNVWIIYRAHVKFVDTPRWEEKVFVDTWAKKDDGLFSIRDFEITDTQGNVRVLATTSWLVMNMESRRVQRLGYAIDSSVRNNLCPQRSAIDEDCPKIAAPADPATIWTRRVRTSDLDYNLHANNAKYLEWAVDTLDGTPFAGREVSEFLISFNSEARPGDDVEMRYAMLSGNSCYVDGRRGADSVFQTVFNFR